MRTQKKRADMLGAWLEHALELVPAELHKEDGKLMFTFLTGESDL
jgi:hypothetical protein